MQASLPICAENLLETESTIADLRNSTFEPLKLEMLAVGFLTQGDVREFSLKQVLEKFPCVAHRVRHTWKFLEINHLILSSSVSSWMLF